jgi:hypothetical protein
MIKIKLGTSRFGGSGKVHCNKQTNYQKDI